MYWLIDRGVRQGFRLALCLGLVTSFALAAGPAGASPIDGHPYRHGAVPDRAGGRAPLPFNAANSPPSIRSHHHASGGAPTSANNLNYGGGVGGIGVTTGPPEVYVVLWGSQWGSPSTDAQGYATASNDPQGVAPILQKFFKGLGTESPSQLWSGVMTQYCEGIATGTQTCPSGSAHVGSPPPSGTLKGVWVDNSAASPSSATGNQLAQEALNAAAHFGKTAATSRNAQYFIVSPTGANPDGYRSGGGYCAWHDYTADPTLSGGGAASTVSNAVAFTNMPYLTDVGASCGANFVNPNGPADGVTIVGGHEYAETITDQFPAGGWTDTIGNENGDKCAWLTPGTAGGSGNITLATGTFPVQTTWGNDGNSGQGACQMSHPIVGAPPPVSGKLKLTLPPTFTAGSAQSGSVELDNSSGAPQSPASPVTVSLTSTGSGSLNPTSVTIQPGSSSAAFTYNDTRAESTTVSASASGYTSASQNETVTAGPTAKLTVSPAQATVGLGGTQAFTVSATDANNNPTNAGSATWSTTAQGSVSPTTGSSTTFTATGTVGGNVTATLGSLSSSATVTIVAQAITNGGFEAVPDFSGWTIGGGKPNPVVSAAQWHGGARSALLGYTPSSGEPTGDSYIQQTFKVPAAGGTLSFWVREFTTDSITYDWQTCEIRNAAGTTRLATIFKDAGNSQTWQQKSIALTNWKSQSVTVWCNVHEDGWGDQTYMHVDDFQVH